MSSIQNRNSRKKPQKANSKHEEKTEKDPTIPVRDVLNKTKKRSSSLSKQDMVRESPQKSRSVDRSISDRYASQNISMKKGMMDTKTAEKRNLKNTPVVKSRTQNVSKNKDLQANNLTSQAAKPSVRAQKAPVKGPSGRTNVEIAKSFVQNAANQKTKKETGDRSLKNKSVKNKHGTSQKKKEEFERPKTSTIRKGISELNDALPKTNMIEIDNQKNFEKLNQNLSLKLTDKKEEDDDKESYEEDFEDYDSDFEESETDSISESSSSESVSYEEDNVLDAVFDRNTVSGETSNFSKLTEPSKEETVNSEHKRSSEKAFLRMSDRSVYSSEITPEKSVEKKLIKPSHSFINFASAVEQEEKKKYSNKVLKRAYDLLEIITLSEVSYNHVDIPPMKYDTFIRCFGKTNYKQVFVQTENGEDEEIQTDEIELVNKWTQNPSSDHYGYGSDTLSSSEQDTVNVKSLFQEQNTKLSSFIQNSSKVMLAVLNEDYSIASNIHANQKRNNLFYSDGYYTLPPVEFLKDVPVLNICCSIFSNYILTIHDGLTKVPHTKDERGIICVWNINDFQKPEYILLAHSQPTCSTFGPSGDSTVIGGMVDGSILLWDLSNSSFAVPDGNLSFMSPTYSTAVVLGKENHHSYVVAIQTLLNYSKSNLESTKFHKRDESKNFHVLTLEDMGIVNIWVVVEVLKPDISGFETDLGLSPGGKLRLFRSSSIFLFELTTLLDLQKINIRTFDFRFVPNDSSRILVTTDVGIVLHVNRQGDSANPRLFSSDLEFTSEVRCIDCSPHNENLFLVGCSDGTAMLFNTKLVRPVMVFLLAAKGDPLTLIQWSPVHPAMFVVLSSTSNLYLWNLLEDFHHPVNSYHFSNSKVTWFSFCIDRTYSSSHDQSQALLRMFISKEDGEIEVHISKHNVSKDDYSRQLEFMKSL